MYAVRKAYDGGYRVTFNGTDINVAYVRKIIPDAVLIVNNRREHIISFPREQHAHELIMKLKGQN